MIQLKRILLPTDFSPAGQSAVEMARVLVDQFGAELHLLHVRDEVGSYFPDFGFGLDFQPVRESLARQHAEAETDILRQLSEVYDSDWKRGKQTTIATRIGKPFVEIVRYAREHDVDLIVLGTHGRTGLTHALLGSVAENVIRTAPCPVLTVRPEAHTFEMP